MPLTLTVGIGHRYFYLADLAILGLLLARSIPVIILGSCAPPRMPDVPDASPELFSSPGLDSS